MKHVDAGVTESGADAVSHAADVEPNHGNDSGVDPRTPADVRAQMLKDRVPPWQEKDWAGHTLYTCIVPLDNGKVCDTDFWSTGECAEHARTQHNYQLLSPTEEEVTNGS